MPSRLRLQIVLPAAAFCLYLAGSAPYLGQWDSFDYLKQIVTHQLSALGIGRPIYISYNILLWESMRRIFRLETLQVESVVIIGTVVTGVLGVVIFQRLSRRFLSPAASQMASVAFAVSPVYAIYSGFIMTEVPMLVLLMAAALVLSKSGNRHPFLSDMAGGILFGLAVGVREQALTMGAVFVWILWVRRAAIASWIRSVLQFGMAAAAVVLAPALVSYLCDPAGFLERTGTWLHAIPIGSTQFRNNAEASLLYAFILCPGAWAAVALAAICRLFRGESRIAGGQASPGNAIPNPVLGILCCLVLPVAFLWRDADVQMHPRYVLIALPAMLVFCASLFHRWFPSRKGAMVWVAMQVLFLGLAIVAFSPFRQTQSGKKEFARIVRDSIPDAGLIIAGNYSPVFDYYRGIGVRPEWRILWSGWNWDARTVEAAVRNAWAEGLPVYLSTDPPGWSYFETEFLDLHFILKDCKRERIAHNLFRVSPP